MAFKRNTLTAAGLALGAVLIAACASEPPPAPPEPTLDEAEFQGMLKDATGPIGSKEVQAEEAEFAAILDRDDLSIQQRAQTYINRAIERGSRGSSPICAVSDYRKGLALYPDHPGRKAIEDDIAYQLDRQKKYPQNFVGPDAYADCDPLAE